MRVTFVLPGHPYGPIGGMVVVYEHAIGLVNAGHKVTVVHPRHESSPWDGAWGRGLTLARNLARAVQDSVQRPTVDWMDVDPRIRMLFVPNLHARHIPRGDAVIATAWWTAEFVHTYPLSKGEKFSLIQGYEAWDGSPDRVDASWRLPLRKFVVSSWLLTKGLELGVERDAMRLVPNGIRLERYPLLQPIESRPDRVAMLFSTDPWKGSADGLQALDIVRSRHGEVEALLFGIHEPAVLPPWATFARRPPLEVLVREIYNRSAVYLSPSWAEGWGLPSTEAIGSGCALVSTEPTGDYAIDGETALLAPPRDPEALAIRLGELLDDPERRIEIAHRGREVLQGFTWERATGSLERGLLEGLSGEWSPAAA